MPFAEVAGGVAVLVEQPGQRGGLRVQPLGHAAALVGRAIFEERGEPPALGVLAGGETAARRRTNR